MNLVDQTVASAQKYTSLAAAKAAGYVPVTPSGARIVHYINPAIYRAGNALDPNQIPSLVYVNTAHGAVLLAAMYLDPKGHDAAPAGRLPDPVAHPHRPVLQQRTSGRQRQQRSCAAGECEPGDAADDARVDDAGHGWPARPGSAGALRSRGGRDHATCSVPRMAPPEELP